MTNIGKSIIDQLTLRLSIFRRSITPKKMYFIYKKGNVLLKNTSSILIYYNIVEMFFYI